jgi:NAD(P)-dependent dehydrogenase (short-subunit alcohol dehydrogenase family)
MTGRLDGRIAVVTGAGQGIGAGIARALTDRGATVVLAGRTVAKVQAVAEELAAGGATTRAVQCDVTDPASIDALFDEVAREVGAPDILINNAQGGNDGTHGVSRVESVSAEECLAQYTGGPLASLRCMQAVFPHMRDRGGRIVNLGSTTGVVGQEGFTPYSMAKEAIHALTKTAAREWGGYGITVNTVCPAALSPAAKEWSEQQPQAYAAVVAKAPLKRLGDPFADIGRAVAALVTDDLGFLTGATLMLDGGMTILR